MTEDEMKANIQNGIAWLDENRSGWRPKVKAKIEAAEFDMASPCDCVIGATNRNFYRVFSKIGLTNLTYYYAVERGFALPFMHEDEADREYAKLTQLWIEAVG